MNSARSSKSHRYNDNLVPESSRTNFDQSNDMNLDTFRSDMNTSRVYTAIAALTAQKKAIEERIKHIDAAIEIENKKTIIKKIS